jgi:ElaB/YqjD/DUF883 family membrane-anchored ribosome-binding protein
MAENDSTPTPMTDADIETPPADTQFEPAAPLKDAGVEFDAERGASGGGGSASGNGTADAPPAGTAGKADGQSGDATGKVAGATQVVRDGVSGIGGQVADKARQFVDDGKSRATGALDQLVQMLNDAAAQVDEKLGAQYGEYARGAATQVQGFAEGIRNKDTDALIEDARGYIRQSPGVAIGVTAALGFAVARLVQAGLDDHRA